MAARMEVARPGPAAAGRTSAGASLRRNMGQIVLFAVLTLAMLMAVVPFIWVIVGSFKSNAEIFQSPFALPKVWRYDNFVRAWVEGQFGTYFFNSLGIAIPTTLLILACGSLAGFAFARLKFWGSTMLFYVFLASLAISTNSIMIPLFHMIYNVGLVDSYWGVVLPTVASHMPMASFLMRSFFRSLPNELEDAARIDGCNNFGVYWHIMLPLSHGALLGLAIFAFMDSWNAFLVPLLVLRDQAMRTIPLGLIVFQGQYLSEYSILFAGVVISFIPTLVVYFALQRHFEKGIMIGSVKG
ncbi:MAG: carbohydrate ABC transporter permease [Chloroflexi bacterium]|nr:carbohydrate ABC transporter permease [Chloroflexota bacterium]